MAVSHINTDSSGDSATGPATLTVTKPTGSSLDSTHILILCIGSGRVTGAGGSYTAPSGWTAVGSQISVTGGAGHVSGQVFWAPGSIASLGFTKSGNIDTAGWLMAAFAGCDTTTPIDATGTANSNTGANSLTSNLVTIATDQAWHLIGAFDWLGGTFSATSFTNSENAAANESAALLYNTTPKSTGDTGTVAVADSAATTNQIIIAVPFALRPAASATPNWQSLAELPDFIVPPTRLIAY